MKKLKLKRSNLQSPYYIKRLKNGNIKQLKELIKPVVYIRQYDLRNCYKFLLEYCGLKPAIYVYVGHTTEPRLSHRDCDIKAKHNTRTYIHKDYISFLDKYKTFCKYLGLNEDVTDFMLYQGSKVKYICDTKEDAHYQEKQLAGHYKWLESFNDISEYNTYLLSDTDSCYKSIVEAGIYTLKAV